MGMPETHQSKQALRKRKAADRARDARARLAEQRLVDDALIAELALALCPSSAPRIRTSVELLTAIVGGTIQRLIAQGYNRKPACRLLLDRLGFDKDQAKSPSPAVHPGTDDTLLM
jgi:hypothetical protein